MKKYLVKGLIFSLGFVTGATTVYQLVIQSLSKDSKYKVKRGRRYVDDSPIVDDPKLSTSENRARRHIARQGRRIERMGKN